MDNLKNFFASQRDFFKSSTLVILFILIIAQFLSTVLKVTIIPVFVSISVTLFCLVYLWLVERKDSEHLKQLNLKLFKAQEDLKTNHVETILSLVLTQEAKDSYTYGHSERVKQYALVIARELGLPKEEMEIIARGAKLHDIGKVGIKDEVLFCKGKLTEEQMVIIKTHPKKGVMILEPLKFLNDEKMIVCHHHERYDGKGYPDGLKGEEIPLGARIVCVADAFDAMRSQRSYRESLTKEKIIVQLMSAAGTQFDPKVINALVVNLDKLYV